LRLRWEKPASPVRQAGGWSPRSSPPNRAEADPAQVVASQRRQGQLGQQTPLLLLSPDGADEDRQETAPAPSRPGWERAARTPARRGAESQRRRSWPGGLHSRPPAPGRAAAGPGP